MSVYVLELYPLAPKCCLLLLSVSLNKKGEVNLRAEEKHEVLTCTQGAGVLYTHVCTQRRL